MCQDTGTFLFVHMIVQGPFKQPWPSLKSPGIRQSCDAVIVVADTNLKLTTQMLP